MDTAFLNAYNDLSKACTVHEFTYNFVLGWLLLYTYGFLTNLRLSLTGIVAWHLLS